MSFSIIDLSTGKDVGFVSGDGDWSYDWTKIYPAGFSVFCDSPILGSYFRVLMLLAKTMERGNLSLLKPAEIAELLKLKRVTVYKALADLRKDGLIRSDSHKGSPGYRVDPRLFYKGSHKHLVVELAKWSAQVPKLATTLQDITQDQIAADVLYSVVPFELAEEILAEYNKVMVRKFGREQDADAMGKGRKTVHGRHSHNPGEELSALETGVRRQQRRGTKAEDSASELRPEDRAVDSG